jgi:rSAM/selenodomain-associated transferase 2
MDIQIIIPTCNEADNIEQLIIYLQKYTSAAIVVANSPATTDNTAQLAEQAGAIVLNCPMAGRATQMNYAAQQTTSELLYFVHADTLPPPTFMNDIRQALSAGYGLGYFSYRFDSERWLLKLNSYFTRYDGLFAGGGDQTLFIQRRVFEQLQGFREDLRLMEDFDLVKRANKAGFRPCLIPKDALVSARKYDNNSWLRVNLVNLWVFGLFHLGASQDYLCRIYRSMLR